jgi:hypothetical protein
MIKFLKKYLQKKPKSFVLDNTYTIVPAFELKGQTYYMHQDAINAATGRGLYAMKFIEEMLMRCSVKYLEAHTKAYDVIFNNPSKINLPALIKLNENLKERIALLAALPEHVYKMASIIFFTKEESPYRYDEKYNEKKIEEWMATEGMYDFFLQTPLSTLIPSLQLPESNSQNYLEVQKKINQLHLKQVADLLNINPTKIDI